MAILTYPLNGITYDAEDVEVYLCTRTSGVFASDGHFTASASGRTVSIGPGLAWIQNEEFHGKAIYNPETVDLAIPEADAYQGRKDRIVLQFDKLLNQTTLVVKEGTPSSSPTAPSIERDSLIYELGLYIVDVPASSIQVTDSNISNTFLDESVCGIMEDAVTGIPTQELYDQWYSWFKDIQTDTEAFEDQFNDWFASIKEQAEKNMEENQEEFDTWMTDTKKDFDDWFDNLEYVLDGDVAGKLEVEVENAQDTADTAMEQLATGWVEGYLTDGDGNALLAEDDDENYAITISRPICNCDDMEDTASGLVSDEFATNKTYSAGDYCIYNNILYKFTADKSAGAWDYNVVKSTKIADEVATNTADIASNASKISTNADNIATVTAGLTDGSVTKVGTSTVGSGTRPIYLSSGTPTASSSTVGSGTKPVYLSSGTVTASSSTVGSSTTPVYMNSGTVTACSYSLRDPSETPLIYRLNQGSSGGYVGMNFCFAIGQYGNWPAIIYWQGHVATLNVVGTDVTSTMSSNPITITWLDGTPSNFSDISVITDSGATNGVRIKFTLTTANAGVEAGIIPLRGTTCYNYYLATS